MTNEILLECDECGRRFFPGSKRQLATSWKKIKGVEVEGCPYCPSITLHVCQKNEKFMRFKDMILGMVFVPQGARLFPLLVLARNPHNFNATYVSRFADNTPFLEDIPEDHPVQVIDIRNIDPKQVIQRLADCKKSPIYQDEASENQEPE